MSGYDARMSRSILRHCHAAGQAPDALLTERGQAQAAALVGTLEHLHVTTIVTSPWARAVASVAPFADARGLAVRTDPRLTEYVLAPEPRPDWQDQLRANFADPDRRLDGGETIREAAARLAAVVEEHGGDVLMVTHGGLIAAYARALGHPDAFLFWQGLRAPALLRVERGEIVEIGLES